jgi:hypothetical protein
VCAPQEMSLDEYEAILAEKKKALNKAAEAKAIDTAAELKGLKAFTKTTTEAQVCLARPIRRVAVQFSGCS